MSVFDVRKLNVCIENVENLKREKKNEMKKK